MTAARWPTLFLGLGLILGCCLATTSIVTATSCRDISQGDVVAWGENVSLSRVMGWHDTLAWWHADHTPSTTPPDLVLTIDHPSRVYIDPHRFPPGNYYQWSGHWERAGNTLAFSVSMTPPALPPISPPPPTPAATENIKDISRTSPLPSLEDRHIADILICRGQPTAILCRNTSALWIFGHTQWAYLLPSPDGTYTLSPNLTTSFPPGDYTHLFQDSGKNGGQEVIYRPEKREVWHNNLRTFTITKTPIHGLVPAQIQDLVLGHLAQSDDGMTIKTLAVQDPSVDIRNLYDAGADTVEVNGYTSVPDGTSLTISIDPERVLTRTGGSTISTPAHQTEPGSLRTWNTRIPIDWNATAPGRHFLTATLPSGAFQTVSFWVYNIPNGQTRPQGFVHYLSGNECESSATIKSIEVVRTVYIPVSIHGPAPPPPSTTEHIPIDSEPTNAPHPPLLLLPILPLLYISSVLFRAHPNPAIPRPPNPFARSAKPSQLRSIRQVVADDLATIRSRFTAGTGQPREKSR